MTTRILKILVIGTAMSAAPLTVKSAKVVVNDAACLPSGGGHCCAETGSYCLTSVGTLRDHYFSTDGVCK